MHTNTQKIFKHFQYNQKSIPKKYYFTNPDRTKAQTPVGALGNKLNDPSIVLNLFERIE